MPDKETTWDSFKATVQDYEVQNLAKLLLLTTNSTHKNADSLHKIKMTLIALFYLNVLKMGGYFENNDGIPEEEIPISGEVLMSDCLSEEELLVGSIIERLLSVVKFNTHEVGQVERFSLTPGGCLVKTTGQAIR